MALKIIRRSCHHVTMLTHTSEKYTAGTVEWWQIFWFEPLIIIYWWVLLTECWVTFSKLLWVSQQRLLKGNSTPGVIFSSTGSTLFRVFVVLVHCMLIQIQMVSTVADRDISICQCDEPTKSIIYFMEDYTQVDLSITQNSLICSIKIT